MNSNDFIFFTLNDFTKDGGGTIRMQSILNALTESGKKVTLLSNVQSYDNFHPSIKHVFINMKMSKQDKKIFQFCVSFLPIFITKQIFIKYGRILEQIINKEKLSNQSIIYCEYLDNSIAYFLKEQKIINDYICDTHGIAPLEFLHKKTKYSVDYFINKFKYMIALRLDKRVFHSATGVIFLSEAMKNYFKSMYPFLRLKKNFVLRDGVNISLCQYRIDRETVDNYKLKYDIKNEDNVILFAGNFKDLGGVLDLVEAFYILVDEKKLQHVKLLLIGDGERYTDARELVKIYGLDDKVLFVGRTKYSELRNYQELSDVIVCPDKQHPFSELVPHIKYFDSLSSGKVVINGSFDSIKEINPDEKFSVNFEPSNVYNLANKMEIVLKNLEYFKIKYNGNKKVICSKFTYNYSVKVLIT